MELSRSQPLQGLVSQLRIFEFILRALMHIKLESDIISITLKIKNKPWLVWLSGLSTGLWTKGSPVQFPVRAHAWVAGQVPSWEPRKATAHWCVSPSLPPSLSLSQNKQIKSKKIKNIKSLATVWVMDWKVARQKMREGSWSNLREGWCWLDLAGSRRAEVGRKIQWLRGEGRRSQNTNGPQGPPQQSTNLFFWFKGLA